MTKHTGHQDDSDSPSRKSDESWNNFNDNNDAEAQAHAMQFMKEHEER